MSALNIAVLVGSLSKDSYNRKIADYLAAHAPADIELHQIQLDSLPVYDRDLDALKPQPERYTALRRAIAQADGVIFVTPEHNAAIPAVLKNAVDICTRPAGQNLWRGKPTGIITAAAAMAGGQRVGDQLRAVCVSLEMPVLPLQTPISQVHAAFDETGRLNSEAVQKRLDSFIAAYALFAAKFA